MQFQICASENVVRHKRPIKRLVCLVCVTHTINSRHVGWWERWGCGCPCSSQHSLALAVSNAWVLFRWSVGSSPPLVPSPQHTHTHTHACMHTHTHTYTHIHTHTSCLSGWQQDCSHYKKIVVFLLPTCQLTYLCFVFVYVGGCMVVGVRGFLFLGGGYGGGREYCLKGSASDDL